MSHSRKYRILEPLDESGAARLYRGIRLTDGAHVLIKVPTDLQDPRQVAQIEHEHRILSALDIRGVARPIGLSKDSDRIALILEEFSGAPWSRLIASSAVDLGATLRVAASLSATLGQLHRRGVIHKDIKSPARSCWIRCWRG